MRPTHVAVSACGGTEPKLKRWKTWAKTVSTSRMEAAMAAQRDTSAHVEASVRPPKRSWKSTKCVFFVRWISRAFARCMASDEQRAQRERRIILTKLKR